MFLKRFLSTTISYVKAKHLKTFDNVFFTYSNYLEKNSFFDFNFYHENSFNFYHENNFHFFPSNVMINKVYLKNNDHLKIKFYTNTLNTLNTEYTDELQYYTTINKLKLGK